MSIQIKKKFIKSQVIDGSKVLFLNNDSFKALDSSGAEVELFKLDGSNKFQLLQMPQLASDPSADEDISRKKYVDDSVQVEADARLASDELLQDQIDALSSSGGAAVAAVQSELDSTQSGAGLSSSGTYVAPVGSNYLDTAVSLKDADSKLDVALKAEVDARIADVDAEETRALAAEGVIASDLAQEILDRAADVDAEETRALAAEGVIAADLAQEILDRAADVDAEETRALAAEGVIAGNLAQEILDRAADVDAEETRAMAAESALDGRLDILEGADTVEGSVAKAEKDAKDYTDAREVAITAAYQAYADQAEVDAKAYTDSEIAALVDAAPALLDTLNELAAAIGDDENFATTVANNIAGVQTAVDAEETRALAAEAAIQSELDATQTGAGLETNGTYSAPGVSNYLSAAVSLKDADSKLDTQIKVVTDGLAQEILDRAADVDAEETRALAAEAALDGRLDVVEGDATTVGSIAKAEADAKAYADGIVDAEETRALSAEGALDARLDIIEGADTVEGSVAKAEKDAKDYTDVREVAITAAYEAYADQAEVDAKAYTDTAISNLVDGAPALLDTLNELAAAINDDANFAATIASQLGSLDSRADALEAASVQFMPLEKFVLSATDISNGYITLSYLAIQHSLRVSADRLAIHQGAANDYTVSTVGGVTRITFVNSLVTPGQEQLSSGDEIYVEGAKIAII